MAKVKANSIGAIGKIVCAILVAGALQCRAQQAGTPSPEQKADAPAAKPAANDSQPRAEGSSGQISENQLVGLPLNGRSYGQLATLQAGVSDPGAEQASRGGGGGSLTISGGRPFSNNFLMDGTNIMNTLNQVPRSAAGVQLGSEAVLQVQVFSMNYGADYGRSSGGVLNSITRSGSDAFHGTLFEYLRNNKLDAKNFFDPEDQPFRRNQFGFLLAGPVRKAGTFFMASFEAMRDRLTEISIDYFPDAQSREGILTNADGSLITDANGAPLPPIAVHPGIRDYLQFYPLPNGARLGRGVAQNRAPQYLPTNENFFVTRIDHKLSDRDGIFGRYVFDDATSDRGEASFQFTSTSRTRQQFFTVVESHVFNPTLLGSVRFGFTRPAGQTSSRSKLDFPSRYFVPGASQFPQIFHASLTPFGPGTNNPEHSIMNSFQISGDVLARRGRHALKLGAEMHRYQWEVFSSSNRAGVWRFSGLEHFLRGGAGGSTTAIVALPGSDSTKNLRQALVSGYLQDAFSISHNFQINAGLRYEVSSLLHDKDGRTAFMPNAWRDPGVQTGPLLDHNPSLRGISPRLSLTWSPFGGRRTVVRAGFGVYYDEILAYAADMLKNSVPFNKTVFRTNFDAAPYFPDIVGAVTAPAVLPLQAHVMDYSQMTNPMVLRHNLVVELPLPGAARLQLSYVGARGNHLLRTVEVNLYPVPLVQPDGTLYFPPSAHGINPAFDGGIHVLTSDAQSFSNALQISVSKSFRQSFSVQANYTYSKSVDDASALWVPTGQGSSGPSSYGLSRSIDRGLSDFDQRQRLAVNYFYNLPRAGGSNWWSAGVPGALWSGWRIGSIVAVRTGSPFTPAVNSLTPGSLFTAVRPSILPGRNNNPVSGVSEGCGTIPRGAPLGTPDLYYDPCVFSVPAPGTLGNLGRNTIISAGIFSMDFSLQKEFILPAKKNLQFRTEIFNLLNRPNFNKIQTGSLNVFTGFPPRQNVSAAIVAGTVTTARQIQFALRLSF